MTEATRSDTASSTSPPQWLNLHAVVDEDLCAELQAVAVEAEGLVDVVRDLAIRAFRASAAFETATTTALKATESGGLPGVSDGLYDLFTQLSGARRLDDALMLLDDHLVAARGESPTRELDWLEAERTAAGVSWPTSQEKSLKDAMTKQATEDVAEPALAG